MTLSPTQLTLRHLRESWPKVETVERWNPHAKIRQDLFGFVDVLAVGPEGTLAVQTTSATNVSKRVRKIREDLPDEFAAVQAAGWQVVVHGWAKRKGRWVLAREIELTESYP
jgi:hypothetical protein